MKKIWLGLIISVIVSSSFADCGQYTPLFKLIAERSNLMQTVAANKYLTTPRGNIFDAKQELKVLQNSQQQAQQLALESSTFLQFTQIQMDASKQIQAYWFDYWQQNPHTAPKPGQYATLATVRQQIKAIDNQLYPQLAKLIKTHPECPVNQLENDMSKLFDTVTGIPHAPDFGSLVANSVIATIKLQH